MVHKINHSIKELKNMNCLILLLLLFCCGDNGCGGNLGCGDNAGCGSNSGCGSNTGCRNNSGCGSNIGSDCRNICGCSNPSQDRSPGTGGRSSRPDQRCDGRQMDTFADEPRRDRGFNPYPSQGNTCGCEE